MATQDPKRTGGSSANAGAATRRHTTTGSHAQMDGAGLLGISISTRVRDVMTRRPPGPERRALRRHGGSTGVLFSGDFNRIRGYLPADGWGSITIVIDGVFIDVVDGIRRGPVWAPVEPQTSSSTPWTRP